MGRTNWILFSENKKKIKIDNNTDDTHENLINIVDHVSTNKHFKHCIHHIISAFSDKELRRIINASSFEIIRNK